MEPVDIQQGGVHLCDIRCGIVDRVPVPGPGRTLVAVNLGPPVGLRPETGGSLGLRRFAVVLVDGAVSSVRLGAPAPMLVLEFEGASGRVHLLPGDGIRPDVPRAAPSLRVAAGDDLLRGLAVGLQTELGREDGGDPDFRGLMARTLLAQALRLLRDAAPVEPRPRQTLLPPFRMRRIASFVEDRMDETITLDDMARIVGISRCHFARVFRATTGMTPRTFVMQRRLDRARQLIATTALSLAEIAYACGFASQSHMCTAFRRQFGTTPSGFRGGDPGGPAPTDAALPPVAVPRVDAA